MATPVAATGDEDILNEVLDDDDDSGLIEGVAAAADFAYGYAVGNYEQAKAEVFGDDGPWSANATAETLRAELATNASRYQRWLNGRLNASDSRNVLAVTVVNESAEATVYLVADVQNHSYRNLSAKRSTALVVDHSCRLEDRAGRNAPAELATFRRDVVAADGNVSSGFVGRLAAEYGERIDCSFTS